MIVPALNIGGWHREAPPALGARSLALSPKPYRIELNLYLASEHSGFP